MKWTDKMFYKLTDKKGNSFVASNEKLAVMIFMDASNPFNCLEMIEETTEETIINTKNQFENYFY